MVTDELVQYRRDLRVGRIEGRRVLLRGALHRFEQIGDRPSGLGDDLQVGLHAPKRGEHPVEPGLAVRLDRHLCAVEGERGPNVPRAPRLDVLVPAPLVVVPLVGLVQCLGQPVRVGTAQRRLALHQRVALGVLQLRRGEARRQGREKGRRLRLAVEQGEQPVASVQLDGLHPAEALDR